MYGRGQQMGFGPPVTPPVVKHLLIAIGVVFVLQIFTRDAFSAPFAIQPRSVFEFGFLWQPFTYMWLHGGLFHALMNCFVLWMFGSQLALAWGTRRFLRFYLLCGVGAGFIIALVPYLAVWVGLETPMALMYSTLGASGAIYGLLLAFSLTWPDRTIMLIFPPVPFRAIWLIPIIFFMTMLSDPTGRISHVGHLGGVIVGWLYMKRRGETGSLLTLKQLQYRWRRYRMRRRLRAVQHEEIQERRRERERRERDRTIH